LAQLRTLSSLAHGHGLRVHMDGARFANALAYLGCTPADMTWRAGIDVLSFGATKNGALAAEAVVFFDAALAQDFERRRKRAAHLYSKHRYLSAQLLCCLEGDWFMDNARRANALAQHIAAAAGSRLRYPVQANAAFVRLSPEQQALLRAQGFEFYPWGPPSAQTVRLVVSWHQPQEEVEQLCEALRACT
jgi:threonine aldolase